MMQKCSRPSVISQTEITTVLNAQQFFMNRPSVLCKTDTTEFPEKDRSNILLSKISYPCKTQSSAFEIIRCYYQVNTQKM